ncbi:FecR family protein [Filimonas effusa]|uniref:FecR family protein n=1 Tax=Filimonas effusa TaxID=2508721 RepID=A0A4Q1D787_9BACT|nr:FecR family protein [Filimonas effusa]RXK83601.1 FecR family protein [Filimonas effusa]
MNKQERFILLWQKYLDDEKMSVAEIRQLRTLIHDNQNLLQINESIARLFIEQTEVYASPETDIVEIFNETWDKLQEEEPEVQPEVHLMNTQPRRHWWKWAAAALLLLTGSTAAYRLLKQDPAPKLAKNTAAQESIRPGTNKAILTLADGSTITLNDAKNGALATQGTTQVVKLANGQLAYQQQSGPAAANLFNTISTPRGGRYHITLPDGTKVWLNAASRLHYPTAFNGSQREVTLSGEAYFEIAENASQPFFVNLDNMQVQVLGTSFNIMAYSDEEAVQTTLLQGKVKVNAPAADAQDKQKILVPGQCASLFRNGILKVQNNVNTEETIAWKNDLIQFAGTDVRAAMRMIARWYDVEIEYKGDVPNAHFRGGLSSDASIEKLLNMMQQTGEVHFQVSGRKIIVSP